MSATSDSPRPAGRRGRRRPDGGFSYFEVLIAVAIAALALAPALEALREGLGASQTASAVARRHQALRAKMEEVLAEPFAALAAEASTPPVIAPSALYSDPPGTPDRRLVEIAPYDGDDADADGDPFTGTDPDLLWVRARIEGGSLRLTSLTSP